MNDALWYLASHVFRCDSLAGLESASAVADVEYMEVRGRYAHAAPV